MLTIKVLGSGCPNCQKVEAHTREALDSLQLTENCQFEHVKDPLEISQYVLKTPGLVINEKVVSEGRIPTAFEIMTWLADALAEAE